LVTYAPWDTAGDGHWLITLREFIASVIFDLEWTVNAHWESSLYRSSLFIVSDDANPCDVRLLILRDLIEHDHLSALTDTVL
jgi:hypothetical protein